MRAFSLFYAIYDYNASQSIAVIKSSGIGVTIFPKCSSWRNSERIEKCFGDN